MTAHFIKNAVLIFEPNEGLKESLKLILEDEYELIFVNDVKEAQFHASSEKVELLILNVDDPVEGLKFIRQINKSHPRLKLFLLSTNFEDSFLRSVRDITLRFNIPEKPFSPNQLKTWLDIFRGKIKNLNFPIA